MKPQAPSIPQQLEETSADELQEQTSLEGRSLKDVDAAGIAFDKDVSWDEVEIIDSIFMQAQLDKLQAMDVTVKSSNLTATSCSEASFIRMVFEKSRMDGANFNKSLLKDVVFRGCKLDLVNFRFVKMQRVRFEDCSLVEADFYNAELKDVEMVGCTLERTVFDAVKVKSLDLRGSQIINLSGWRDLKNVTIDNGQLVAAAASLAAEVGIKVKEG